MLSPSQSTFKTIVAQHICDFPIISFCKFANYKVFPFLFVVLPQIFFSHINIVASRYKYLYVHNNYMGITFNCYDYAMYDHTVVVLVISSLSTSKWLLSKMAMHIKVRNRVEKVWATNMTYMTWLKQMCHNQLISTPHFTVIYFR